MIFGKVKIIFEIIFEGRRLSFYQNHPVMKIEYICHSSILITTKNSKIITDPWFNGPCYLNQWNVFPKPVNTSWTNEVTHVLISHGHEDHLHVPTLNLIRKDAEIFYPYQWKSGIISLFSSMGFQRTHEAISFKTHQLDDETKVTYIANSLDSIVVIENNGQVILNLNDALNSHHKFFIKLFVEQIKKHWKKIDVMICGMGGAGYFPNTVHYPGKNDREIGELREQFLVHNFCKLVQDLQPEKVIPFVPGFVLLADDKRWINEIKFDRNKLSDYYKNNFDGDSKIEFLPMQPGDILEKNEYKKVSPYREEEEVSSVEEMVLKQYGNEILEYNKPKMADEETANTVIQKLRKYVPLAAKVYHPELLQKIKFAIRLNDVEQKNYFNVNYYKGNFEIFRTENLLSDRTILIRTTSEIMLHSFASEWGGDVLFVGYGADVDVFDVDVLQDNLDIVCLRLLTRYPTASKTMIKNPMRALKYLFTNPHLSKLAVTQKIKANGNPNKLPFNERSHWINKSKCEVCMACDIPLMSDEWGEILEALEVK